jgi:class 3 adenylate cyclase
MARWRLDLADGDGARRDPSIRAVTTAARLSDLAKSLPSGIAARAEVVEVGDGERSWQPAGRTRLRGMKADTPYHVPSETR